MKEYTYQLEKDDYREWIQWNIKKHDQKKVRYITVGVMMALLAMTLIGNLPPARLWQRRLVPPSCFWAWELSCSILPLRRIRRE